MKEELMRRTHLLNVLVAILLVTGLLAPSAATASSSTMVKLWIGKASMSVNGAEWPIDAQGTKPVIVEGRTLVPIRAVIEVLGGSAAWESSTRKATVTLGKDSLDLWIGKSQASLNGIALAIDSANSAVVPVITGGRTMLPLRFVAESLGIDVQYDATTKMITLTYTVGTTPPALLAPLLLGPAPNAVLSVLTPTLSWTTVLGATKYEVRIWVGSATRPPFIFPGGTPSPYLINNVLATTSYTVPSGVLTSGVQYAWTVYAGNSLSWSASLTAPGSTYVPVFMVQAAFQAPSPGVIETQINGEFTGWDGDTIFELTNGQIWQQDSYAYTYHYAYRPKVLIYYVGGRYKMTVEGVDGFIYVTRLK
jgi:hypothetical protein